jgi:hypothetical protein
MMLAFSDWQINNNDGAIPPSRHSAVPCPVPGKIARAFFIASQMLAERTDHRWRS